MNKAAIKVLSINLLVFAAYTLVSMLYPSGWLILMMCLFMHTIVCVLLALGNDEKNISVAGHVISILLILLIGVGTCVDLFKVG